MKAGEFLVQGATRLGGLVFRYKVVFLCAFFLLLPVAALALAVWAPSIGKKLFSFTCHQGPFRSFVFAGNALPLCSRCLGLYAGFGLAGLLVPAVSRRFSISLVGSAFLFSAGLFGLRYFFPALDANAVRLVLGLMLGSGVILFLKSCLKD